MIRLGTPPRLADFTREARATVDAWFNQVSARFNAIWKAGATVNTDVPINQWGIFKNTVTGLVELIINDLGTLKSIPFATTRPVFSALASAATAMNSGVNTKITFGTELFDTDSMYDAANSKFQPTVPGYYNVHAQVTMNQATATVNLWQVGIYKTGAVQYQVTTVTTAVVANFTQQVTGTVFLNGSTDYVEIFAFQNSGVARNTVTSVDTAFMAELVRPT